MVALNYVKDHVQRNQYSRPGDKLLRVQAIVVHYTANPNANALMHANYFDGADGGGGRYAGAHIFVDRHEAREIIPLNEVAYHANERRSGPLLSALRATASYYPGGNANLLTVGIEMCMERDGSIHPDTIARTQAVIRKLQADYPQLRDTKNRVVRHFDVTGKACPLPYVNNAKWQAFLAGVDSPNKPAPVKPAAPTPTKPEVDELYEKAIVVNSFADISVAETLHNRTGWPFFLRSGIAKNAGKVAKELVIVGGGKDGLGKHADKLTDLSGKTRKDTSDKTYAYIAKL